MIRPFLAFLALNLISLYASLAHAELATFSVLQEQFVSPDYKVTEKKQFLYFQGRVSNFEKGKEYDGFRLNLIGQYSSGEPLLNYFNISEVYVATESLIFGRKKETWNWADQYWKLGSYQPLFKWNPLEPEEQGLTGIYVRLASPSYPIVLTVMGSPVFIPDQGPGYEIQDGRFEKSHPYFQAPPTHANVSGQTDTIVYKVVQPNVQDIVMNSAYAAKLEYGDFVEGFSARTSYAYKPSNQLNLGFRGAIIPDQSVEVEVNPQINYHRLVSLDTQYAFSKVAFGISIMHEKVSNPKFTEEWTYAIFDDALIFSPYSSLKISKHWSMVVSALQIHGAESHAAGSHATQGENLFSNRYPYKEASSFAFKGFVPLKKFQSVDLSLSYTREVRGQTALIIAKGDYNFSNAGSVFVQGQLISTSEEKTQNNLYANYVNNDLFRMGLKYVF